MSTSVTQEEWPTLTMVPEENWGYRWASEREKTSCSRSSLGRCDIEPSHGYGSAFMQTPDHRAIVLCEKCLVAVKAAKA